MFEIQEKDMRVESDVKLGFKDVLIRPKRSTLKSRSEVGLQRTYKFYHTQTEWTGIPIVAANMDTVGTFSMANVLRTSDMLTAIHKHYSLEEWGTFMSQASEKTIDHVMVSTGTSKDDLEKTIEIFSRWPSLSFFCIDVAFASCLFRKMTLGYLETFCMSIQK